MVVAVVSSGSICALFGQPPLCLPGCDPRQRDFSARCPEAVSLVLISLVLLPRAFQLYWYANGAALFIPDQGYPSPAAVISLLVPVQSRFCMALQPAAPS